MAENILDTLNEEDFFWISNCYDWTHCLNLGMQLEQDKQAEDKIKATSQLLIQKYDFVKNIRSQMRENLSGKKYIYAGPASMFFNSSAAAIRFGFYQGDDQTRHAYPSASSVQFSEVENSPEKRDFKALKGLWEEKVKDQVRTAKEGSILSRLVFAEEAPDCIKLEKGIYLKKGASGQVTDQDVVTACNALETVRDNVFGDLLKAQPLSQNKDGKILPLTSFMVPDPMLMETLIIKEEVSVKGGHLTFEKPSLVPKELDFRKNFVAEQLRVYKKAGTNSGIYSDFSLGTQAQAAVATGIQGMAIKAKEGVGGLWHKLWNKQEDSPSEDSSKIDLKDPSMIASLKMDRSEDTPLEVVKTTGIRLQEDATLMKVSRAWADQWAIKKDVQVGYGPATSYRPMIFLKNEETQQFAQEFGQEVTPENFEKFKEYAAQRHAQDILKAIVYVRDGETAAPAPIGEGMATHVEDYVPIPKGPVQKKIEYAQTLYLENSWTFSGDQEKDVVMLKKSLNTMDLDAAIVPDKEEFTSIAAIAIERAHRENQYHEQPVGWQNKIAEVMTEAYVGIPPKEKALEWYSEAITSNPFKEKVGKNENAVRVPLQTVPKDQLDDLITEGVVGPWKMGDILSPAGGTRYTLSGNNVQDAQVLPESKSLIEEGQAQLNTWTAWVNEASSEAGLVGRSMVQSMANQYVIANTQGQVDRKALWENVKNGINQWAQEHHAGFAIHLDAMTPAELADTIGITCYGEWDTYENMGIHPQLTDPHKASEMPLQEERTPPKTFAEIPITPKEGANPTQAEYNRPDLASVPQSSASEPTKTPVPPKEETRIERVRRLADEKRKAKTSTP